MVQRTRLTAAGSSLPGSHGLFLVAANGVPVQLDLMAMPMNKPTGLRLVRAGEMRLRESEQKRPQRGILERISRAIRAFKAS
jgi:hypothetical protein